MWPPLGCVKCDNSTLTDMASSFYFFLPLLSNMYCTPTASEKRVASSVRELCNQAGAISLTSKAELADGLHSAKITLYTLGGGIAFVLAFIGIINFANIMFTNIEARRHELSVMESIGMTKKQCRRMLQILVCGYIPCAVPDSRECIAFGGISSV